MTSQVIPPQAVEAAAKVIYSDGWDGTPYWESMADDNSDKVHHRAIAQNALEAAAPHMLADILEDAANTAETDELTTAAEVIYDLRRHAKDLRPTDAR